MHDLPQNIVTTEICYLDLPDNFRNYIMKKVVFNIDELIFYKHVKDDITTYTYEVRGN